MAVDPHPVVGHSDETQLMEDVVTMPLRLPAITMSRSPSSLALWGRVVRDAVPFSELWLTAKVWMTRMSSRIFSMGGRRGIFRCLLDFEKLYLASGSTM